METSSTDFPVCPYCGYIEHDDWDIDFGINEDCEPTCNSCGADYLLSKHVKVTYTSSKAGNQ